MADVVESLEVGWVIPPKAVGAFLFFLNLGRVEGFGFDGKGSRAKREPRGDDVCEVEVEDEEVFVGKSLTATVTSSSSSLSSEDE